MTTMYVRQALLSDATQIARLMTQLGYPTTPTQMHQRLDRLLDHGDYCTYVAEAQGVVLGVIGVCTSYFYEQNGLYGRIVALIVDAQHRGRGIGALLVQQAEAWCAMRGAALMLVNSGTHRVDAHRFYQRCDYRVTGIRLIKAILSTAHYDP
ncbi:MAG: GNAT family N-acetyltransferase [Ardenticatenaceae bacterium]|nr:GNAT family N-acetyltransferase [Ardenticatenaceae bacterium]